MTHSIDYLESVVLLDIPQLPKRARILIKSSIEKRLLSEPEKYGIPLRRSLSGLRKLRISNYRVIFQINGKKVTIVIIDHRKTVYQNVMKRLSELPQ